MQRRLAALESVKGHAGPRRLALATPRRGLALARADAAPHPLGAVMRPGIVPDLVELHRLTDPMRVRGFFKNHSTLFHHPNEVLHLVDHTPNRGRVFENAPAMPLVQP